MKLVRCNRCGGERELPQDGGLNAAIRAMTNFGETAKWSKAYLSKPASVGAVAHESLVFDLCEDCREVFLEQFMQGAEVAPITKSAAQTVLPHDPMTDCQLVYDADRGRFLCYHDDPARFQKLTTDVLQNVVEGVDAEMVRGLQVEIQQMTEDVELAGKAHAFPQRCSKKCVEEHTYEGKCLLANLPPAQRDPAARCEGCGCIAHPNPCSSTGCFCEGEEPNNE